MKDIKKAILLSASLALLASCGGKKECPAPKGEGEVVRTIDVNLDDKKSGGDQFNFPGNYEPPELEVDGFDHDPQYEQAIPYITFGATNSAKMKLYCGQRGLFCFFSVRDPDLETVGENNGDDVTKGDSVEVYFDFNNDGANKPQSDDIQINIGAHGKTRIFVGNNGEWGSWNGLLDYEIYLDGTLNDPSDTDYGFNVELMIPYAQVGIEQDSVFGIAFGHVQRGRDSTNSELQYTWGGLVYEGSFVDPQCPHAYIIRNGDRYYSRSSLPQPDINLMGRIIDQNGTPVDGAKVQIDGKEVTSGANGSYLVNGVDPNEARTLTITKTGFKTYEEVLSSQFLKGNGDGEIVHNIVMLNESITAKVTITGVVKNPVYGAIEGATVKIGDKQTTTASNGSFSLQIDVDNNLAIEVSKETFKSSITELDANELTGKTSYDVGDIALYSPSSSFTFAGTKGMPLVTCEVYRGFEGINFLFSLDKQVSNGDHIELFVDSGYSYSGRDASDYRFDFRSDGTINIVNFGGRNIPVSTSGVTNKDYLIGVTYYLETFVPYRLLEAEPTDIIGISAGYWSQSINDWDGWNFPAPGWPDYVAPEYTDKYVRIGSDNSLYRSSGNTTITTSIHGYVKNANGVVLPNALINGTAIAGDGSYNIRVESGQEITLTFTCIGYGDVVKTFSASETSTESIKFDVVMVVGLVVVEGSINVNGATITYQEDTSIVATSSDGHYSITIPTSSNAHLVFTATGYKQLSKAIGVNALKTAANAGVPYELNVTLETV